MYIYIYIRADRERQREKKHEKQQKVSWYRGGHGATDADAQEVEEAQPREA